MVTPKTIKIIRENSKPHSLLTPKTMKISTENSKPHLLLLSSPGMGHLIPVLELGKQLATQHNLNVTVFVVSSQSSEAETKLIQHSVITNNTTNLFEIVELPSVDVSGLVGPNAAVVTQIRAIMREIRTALRSAISAIKSNPTALVVDLFGTEALCVADEFGLAKYVYIASNAWFLSFLAYLPVIDKELQGEYVDQIEPFRVPGCRAVRPIDLIHPLLVRSDPQCGEAVRIGEEIPMGDGILVNTWEDLERTTLVALRNKQLLGQIVKVPIFTVGPLTRPPEPSGSHAELFCWLDKQPNDSVLYVSFGSGGTLSWQQIIELAWGIELAKQRFIWVVRPPTVTTGDGSFFTTGNHEDDTSAAEFSYLPEAFMDQTKNVGLVVSEWAPQVKILGHPSVGGFLSHCGWNSTLESISNGVPMIAWPLYAEQRMNATLLTEELGMAVRPENILENEVVRREEIERMVRKIMVDEEGYSLRAKAEELKCSAQKAWSKGGSSYNALSEIAKVCERTSKPDK